MSKVFIPAGYHSCLSLYDTQKAISLIKRVFEDTLCGNLNLSPGYGPGCLLEASTGLNDDLNGVERPVSFDVPDIGRDAQVVHSLAKWKLPGAAPLRLPSRQGPLYRYECHPAG